MKKLNVLCCALSALALSSCGFKSEVKPLTEKLETFTAPSEDSKEILTGVRENATGRILVAPGVHKNFQADDYVITYTTPVYNTLDRVEVIVIEDGKSLGFFDSFSSLVKNSYYVGKVDESSVYYFPKLELVIETNLVYETNEYLFLQTETGWDIRTHEGKLLWQAPAAFTLIKNQKNTDKEEYVAAVPLEGKNAGAVLYNLDGTEKKKLSPARWRSLLKKLKEQSSVGFMVITEAKDLSRI